MAEFSLFPRNLNAVCTDNSLTHFQGNWVNVNSYGALTNGEANSTGRNAEIYLEHETRQADFNS